MYLCIQFVTPKVRNSINSSNGGNSSSNISNPVTPSGSIRASSKKASCSIPCQFLDLTPAFPNFSSFQTNSLVPSYFGSTTLFSLIPRGPIQTLFSLCCPFPFFTCGQSTSISYSSSPFKFQVAQIFP